MADYNVQSSDGTFTVNVQTGTINNTYDVPFIGQDAINYGDDLVANQLRLLENFSNTSAPSFGTTRVKGQLWYDSTPVTGRLNIFDGASWDKIPLDIDVVHLSGAETITDVKTFSSAAAFTVSTISPFTVNSDTVVTNLNADKLDGEHLSFFATSVQGAKADAAQIALPANAGADGYVLSSTLLGVYTWISPTVSAGQVATQAAETIDTTTNVLLVGNEPATIGGTVQDPLWSSGLTFNANTNALAATTFIGALTGTATNATSATTATTATTATNITVSLNASADTTTYPVLVGAPTATDQLPFIDNASLFYNASTGQLNATLFVGGGAGITDITTNNITAGTLSTTRGGTGVNLAAQGTGAVVLNIDPTFGTRITTPAIRNGATGTTLEFNSVAAFRIVDETAADQSTGAEVVDAAGTFRPVGIAPSPQTDVTTATELLTQARASATLRCNSGSAQAVTTENNTGAAQTDIPDGTMWIVKAFGAGAVTIVAGTSVTLRWWDGAGGAPSTGTRTLARGGLATVQKIDDSNYDVWGVGLT